MYIYAPVVDPKVKIDQKQPENNTKNVPKIDKNEPKMAS